MKRTKKRCPKTGKLAHNSYLLAARHVKKLAKLNREDVDAINIYECEHCDCFHVGHKAKQPKRKEYPIPRVVRAPAMKSASVPDRFKRKKQRGEFLTMAEFMKKKGNATVHALEKGGSSPEEERT